MEKTVNKYHLKDPQQYEDEREYWRSKTPEEKLMALEAIRETRHKLNPDKDEAAKNDFSSKGFLRRKSSSNY